MTFEPDGGPHRVAAPMLPMQPNMPERRTHDYRRHGTTTLFAALEIATGHVVANPRRSLCPPQAGASSSPAAA